ncbi:MAG: 6-carboxytetrahydropterin synthase [Bacteroidales bacterium]|jgi:6-pyruvoyltetrahydropterin/6-carboxytetrahydropterin synthase|nr:6-carboxytetrahydropterin synthase [Bacteroidales bacterium]MDD2424732.1 6-carboxytetrahydropterin synthase [Bacteroidales bacterium]MDD3989299.1 6-carboxytetrahydropterin synthase [Bacteroidales bacterium]MDD4639282.1 6-carboxytetrahydropterin synthase [Bacteroidales bacterium]
MSKIRITKEFRFEGAHALRDYDGKCRHIHGHSYALFVTVTGEPLNIKENPKDGMVMDFGLLKKLVNDKIIEKFDHALILRSDAPLAGELSETYSNVVTVDFQPTCENLAIHFASLLSNSLPDDVNLHSVKLYETPTSYVEWIAQENL